MRPLPLSHHLLSLALSAAITLGVVGSVHGLAVSESRSTQAEQSEGAGWVQLKPVAPAPRAAA